MSQYHPVMNIPAGTPEIDLTEGFDRAKLVDGWAYGGYNERRINMYTAPQYEGKRYIHMGIDVWADAGEPVFAVSDGEVVYLTNHDQKGNYGVTIVLKQNTKNEPVFALYGHLSLASLNLHQPGNTISAGDMVGWLGDEAENGGWIPHLHYQLSLDDPGEADMPGVVSDEELKKSLEKYPDPLDVFGNSFLF